MCIYVYICVYMCIYVYICVYTYITTTHAYKFLYYLSSSLASIAIYNVATTSCIASCKVALAFQKKTKYKY